MFTLADLPVASRLANLRRGIGFRSPWPISRLARAHFKIGPRNIPARYAGKGTPFRDLGFSVSALGTRAPARPTVPRASSAILPTRPARIPHGKRRRQKSQNSWRNTGVPRNARTAAALIRLFGKGPHARRVSRRISECFSRDGDRRAPRSAAALSSQSLNARSARRMRKRATEALPGRT